MAEIRRISSDGPWEDLVGYSRAVVAGPFIFVSGCTSVVDGNLVHEGDPYGQTMAAFRVAEQALLEAGATLADVVRTRMYITHSRDQYEVGRAHKELFADIRPAATMVEISGLVAPQMLVEIEVTAYRPADTGKAPEL